MRVHVCSLEGLVGVCCSLGAGDMDPRDSKQENTGPQGAQPHTLIFHTHKVVIPVTPQASVSPLPSGYLEGGIELNDLGRPSVFSLFLHRQGD